MKAEVIDLNERLNSDQELAAKAEKLRAESEARQRQEILALFAQFCAWRARRKQDV